MMSKTIEWETKIHLKYTLASLRVSLRKIFRSYLFFIVAIISLIIIVVVPILTSKSTINNIEEFWFNKEKRIIEYSMEEKIWIFQSQFLTSFTFGSLLSTLILVLPIMLLLNRILLNPLRSGLFLIYLSTPIKKSTNLIMTILVSTMFVFFFITLSEVMKYTVFFEIIQNELKREVFGLTLDAIKELKNFYLRLISANVGYMFLFGLFLILLVVLLGINFSQMATSIFIIFLSIIFGPLYLGIQIAFTKIPTFRDNIEWIYQVIAFFWIGAYPIFISFHSYIDAGYLDLSNKIGSKLRNNFFSEPFMYDLEKNNNGDIRSFLYLQKDEMLITLSLLVIILTLFIYFFWRRKRIL